MARLSASSDKQAEAFIENVPANEKEAKGRGDDSASESSVVDASRRLHEEKHLVRKLDMRLMPTIFLIFIMNYIDVSNSLSIDDLRIASN